MTSPAPHWHLILNHLPTVGTALGLALLICSFAMKSSDLERVSLGLFALLGLAAIPVYVTGGAAWSVMRDLADVSPETVSAHEDAALFAFVALLFTGWLAWFALWQLRRFSRPFRWSTPAVAAMAVLGLLLMVRTGTLGGSIRHPEIVSGQIPTAPGYTDAIRAWVVETQVTWPALEAVHFVGMAMLFGVVLLMTIRVFGIGRGVPFSALHRMLPLGIFGFMLNVGSGMLFFLADTDRYSAMTIGFYPKIGLIVIGGAGLLYFTLFEDTWKLAAGDEAPLRAKLAAAVILLLWSGVIVYGRLLPYLEGG
jgi:hypothetical protein